MSDIKKNVSKGSTFGKIISCAAIIIAVCSFWIAWQSHKVNKRIVMVNTYMALRKNFAEVSKDIRSIFKYDDSNKMPRTESELEPIYRYWYFTFDEWYITTQLDEPSLQQLWDDRYKDIVSATLEKKVYRDVVCNLIKKKFLLNKKQKEFGNVLKKIYQEKSGKHLCPE